MIATLSLAACGDEASNDIPTDDASSDASSQDAGTAADAGGTTNDAAGVDGGDASDTGAADAGAGSDAALDAPGVDTFTDATSSLAGVVTINEVAAAGTPDDWFELANSGDADVDLSGWTFTDDIVGQPGRSPFPDGAIVPASGFLLVQFEGEFPGFGLSGDEELGVHDADGALVDGVDWNEGDSPEAASLGRIPNFEGAFLTLFTPTPGEANIGNDEACGNGSLDPGEGCDDGGTRAGDGCSSLCEVEDGYACDGAPSVCATVCGDGIIAGDEECDDGNAEDDDGCSSACVPDGQVCGDGVVDPGEGCDDGNTEDDDGCSDACRVEASSPSLVLNEIAAAGEPEDWIELLNVAPFPVGLEGWTLTDDNPENVWTMPFVIVDAGARVSFERNAEGSFDFGLARGGDSAVLATPAGDRVDFYTWADGESPEGGSISRIPDGTGDWQTTVPGTRDAPNEAGDGM